MDEIIKSSIQLPDSIEDLSRFVLVNEERIQALRAEIRAIKKVSLAKEVYEQKLVEAQEIGQVTVEAAQKMGELLLQIQKHQGNSSRNNEEYKTKTEVTSEMGISKDQVSQYQQMAQNPEAVRMAIKKAIETGDVVSRSQVMKEIRVMKEKIKALEEIRDEQALKKMELKKRITELEENPQIKEVTPSDYEDLKKKAKFHDAEIDRLKQKLQKAYEERNDLQDEIKDLQVAMTERGFHTDVKLNALYFCYQCKAFLQEVAGYIWIVDKLEDLSDLDRSGFIKGAMSIRDWASVLLENIERNEEYGKPELQRIIEERTIE